MAGLRTASLTAALFVLGLGQPDLASGQAVPKSFPVGEIEIGLTIIPFSNADILRIETFEIDDLYAVEITLADHLGADLAKATSGKIGYEVAVIYCGRRLIDARIQEELTAAVFIVTSGDKAEIEEIAQQLLNPPCAEL